MKLIATKVVLLSHYCCFNHSNRVILVILPSGNTGFKNLDRVNHIFNHLEKDWLAP